MMVKQLLGEKKFRFVVFSNFHGVNALAMA